MKNDHSKRAFTLIELILSTILVAVVLLGIFSISNVLSNNSQDYGQRYLVKSETQTTLNNILNNAALAVGSVNCNDEAILIGNGNVSAACGGGANGLTDSNSFCIHQAGKTNNGQNMIGSSNDIWLCYSWSANQINWCAETYSGPGADPRGAAVCNSLTPVIAGTSMTFLGTANTGFALQTPPPTFTSNGAQLLFSITLQNCLNNSAATCNGNGANPGSTPGVSSDPVNNPEVVVSGSVTPSQVSNS